MVDFPELPRLTATEVVALTRSGKLSVVDYAKSLLAQVEKRDSVVHAWVFLDSDLVLAQARALDQIPADKRGPLHGIAIGVKVSGVQRVRRCSQLAEATSIGRHPHKGYGGVGSVSRSLAN
jgi:hypothetical protein